MEFMRTNYPDLAKSLAKQHFGCTVVEEATEATTIKKEGLGEEADGELQRFERCAAAASCARRQPKSQGTGARPCRTWRCVFGGYCSSVRQQACVRERSFMFVC